MCLVNSKEGVEKFLKKRRGNKWVTLYKGVNIILKPEGFGLIQNVFTQHQNYIYKPRWNKSTSDVKKVCKQERRKIRHGIHCFTNPKHVKCGTKVIKLKALLSDLIGVSARNEECVFSKVWLSEKEYKRAIQ